MVGCGTPGWAGHHSAVELPDRGSKPRVTPPCWGSPQGSAGGAAVLVAGRWAFGRDRVGVLPAAGRRPGSGPRRSCSKLVERTRARRSFRCSRPLGTGSGGAATECRRALRPPQELDFFRTPPGVCLLAVLSVASRGGRNRRYAWWRRCTGLSSTRSSTRCQLP